MNHASLIQLVFPLVIAATTVWSVFAAPGSVATLLPAATRAPALAVQEGGQPLLSTGVHLVVRDRRVAFDAASAQSARLQLESLRPGDPRRAVALVTVGAAHAYGERPALVAAAIEGATEDRTAAILGLGELGEGIGDALGLLERLALAESGELQAACLVALARVNQPASRAMLARLAEGAGLVAAQAREVLAHAVDPDGTLPPLLWRQLYHLRWEAGRLYGTVDGRPWRLVRVDELAKDQKFLEGFVLLCSGRLAHGAARDHMLEVLMASGGPAARIDAAVQLMPEIVERLVDSGVWRPSNRAEWMRLVQAIANGGEWRRFPATLAAAAVVPEVRPTVAGLLNRVGSPYEDTLSEAFRSDIARDRANAAFAVGCSAQIDFLPVLRDLTRDPEPWVQANAIIARLRMGDASATPEAEALITAPLELRQVALVSYLFEVFERAAPDRSVVTFLESILPGLRGEDRVNCAAILVLYGRSSDTAVLREALPQMDPGSLDTFRVLRALGRQPTPADLEALALAFPFDGSNIANLYAAAALVRGHHRAVDGLMAAAVWDLDADLAFLAAGVVAETRGTQVLRHWVVRPPQRARAADLRRVGFALGEWGGPKEVDALLRDLGTSTGADEPAYQGATLGMLGDRTR